MVLLFVPSPLCWTSVTFVALLLLVTEYSQIAGLDLAQSQYYKILEHVVQHFQMWHTGASHCTAGPVHAGAHDIALLFPTDFRIIFKNLCGGPGAIA